MVHGDLAGARVLDRTRQYSEKLTFAQDEPARGRHVHVVDAAGFSDLLGHPPANCRRLRRAFDGILEVVSEQVDGLLREPFNSRQPARRTPQETHRLAINLEALDRATAPHERTARLLAAATDGARPRLAAWRGPQFDLRWYRWRRLYMAEVKSLTGTR